MLSTENNVYCTAPFNGITVRENGDVKTCCVGAETIGNLSTQSIQAILQSEKLKRIQTSMLDGSSNLKNCGHCVLQEKQTGLASLRQHYSKYYPIVHGNLKLKNLDIRWNNLCNLGCVYCSPMFSSVWEDRLTVRVHSATKPYQDDLLEFILNNVDQVQEITLVGGEPLLMKQNYKLLEQLPQHTQISLITNFSYDLERLPCFDSLVNRPKANVKWNLSLENSHKKFEYVRNGADWSQVEKNIQLLNKHWPDSACVNIVYSVFTAFDIDQAIATFHALGIKKFNFQSYFGHPAFDVFSMPRSLQQVALNRLHKALEIHHNNIDAVDIDLFPIQNIDHIIAHLQSEQTATSSLTKQKFYDRVEWCNQWNSDRFQDLWPDVINLVDSSMT